MGEAADEGIVVLERLRHGEIAGERADEAKGERCRLSHGDVASLVAADEID